MSISKKFLSKLLSGLSDKNIKFSDLRNLMMNLGFSERVKGDHHIFTRPDVEEILNLQPLNNGSAKPYQVKQVRKIILKYKFHREALKDV